ncbi:MAG: hypothetical protein V3V75_02745, partial [Thermoguttaceae bacterium]
RGVWASGVVLQQHFHHPALPRTQASNDETARAERFSAFAPLPATSLASALQARVAGNLLSQLIASPRY